MLRLPMPEAGITRGAILRRSTVLLNVLSGLSRLALGVVAGCVQRRLSPARHVTAGWLDAQEGESALRNLRTRPDETAIVGRAAVSPLENCASGYEINRVWASQHDQPPTLRPGPVQTRA